MLTPQSIEQTAVSALVAGGFKSELSPQAKAVVAALVEAFNQEMYRVATENAALVDELAAKFQQKKRDAAGVLNRHFVKPKVEEVVAQGIVIGLEEIECLKFHDFYESKGWQVGKVPMKQWHCALANWKRRMEPNSPEKMTSAQINLKRMALSRVEERIRVIKNHFPLPKGDPKIQEYAELRAERLNLMNELGLKI